MRAIVITPTYNERDNIVQLIEAVLELPVDLDILIVDDDSPDQTAELAESCREKNGRVHILRRNGQRGLGRAYVDGFKYALKNGYDLIFSMDADFSHDPKSLQSLMLVLEGHDVAVGSRYCHGRVSVVNWPLHRLFLSVFAGKYVRLVTGLKIFDPTSGFRGFRSQVLKAIDLDSIRSNGYSFQVETLYRAKRCGFSIKEVPIIFTERREGQSKMSKKIILEAAVMPWKMRLGRFQCERLDH